jgi:hypothetical protein
MAAGATTGIPGSKSDYKSAKDHNDKAFEGK